MWSFLRHLLTPHHSNNHRPRALHPQAFFVYILLILILQLNFVALKVIAPNILGLATDINVERLVVLTNQKRAEAGMPPVSLDPQLSQAATGKANDMFAKGYWAHNSPDGLTPWVFIKNAGYSYTYAGENLAKNFANSEGVVEGWMASPSHRANLLKSDYQDVGFAVVNGRLGGEETTLVVQMFGSRQTKTLAVKPPVQAAAPKPTVAPSQAAPVLRQVSLTPSPTPEIASLAQSKGVVFPTQLQAPSVAAAGVRKPTLNLFAVTKNTSLILAVFLMMVFAIDGFLIWRRKTVRIAGHSFAHFVFLTAVVGAIWLTGQGAIR